jgi:hypothetical protein
MGLSPGWFNDSVVLSELAGLDKHYCSVTPVTLIMGGRFFFLNHFLYASRIKNVATLVVET